MKKLIPVLIIISGILIIQCGHKKKSKSTDKSSFKSAAVLSTNEIPVKEAHAWQDSLANSQFTIYENFNGQYLFLSDVKKKVTQSGEYMCLFLGKTGKDYRLISVVCQGTLTAGNFNNDYNTLEYFDGSGWTNTVYDSLEVWLDSFKYALPTVTTALPYAMVIPNEDFSGLEPYIQNDKVYISFGLDGSNIEMMLGSEDNTDGQLGSPNERYYDNTITCPTKCAGNDPS